ncbi:MAG: LysM peptidoglycan-binding domain-containing protein [Candidatus Dojkabacteria bacterium]
MKLMKKFAKYTTLALSIGLFLFFFVTNAQAIEYFHIGGRPAYPDPEVENSKAWFIYNLNPGEQKEDALEVVNNYEEPLEMLVYAADGIKSSNGGFALKQYVEEKTAVGSWIRFYPDDVPTRLQPLFENVDESILAFCSTELIESESIVSDEEDGLTITKSDIVDFNEWCEGEEEARLEVEPETIRLLRFVFSVPEDAEVGEHTGGILVQKVEPEKEGTTQGITLTTRVGVRIYQTVPGEIVKDLNITDFKIQKMYKELDFSGYFSKDAKAEEYLITTKLANRGNVSISFTENIAIKNELTDEIIQEVTDREFQVLRDDEFTSNFSWNNPRFGKYSFMNVVSYEDTNGNIKSLPSPKITIWIIPYREILLALGAILLTILIVSMVKIAKKAKYSGKGWDEYVVKAGESLGDLSMKFDVNWKTLARTNNIKPPYVIKPGDTILVPKKKK